MTEEKTKNYFEILNAVDVSEKVEKKSGLSYLSWAWAWAELKKRHPAAKKEVIKNDKGWLYHTDGNTCWVEVKVTIDEIEETEYLPILDYKNKPISLEAINSMQVNTSIQRAITKAIARHGLGLYIYAGEDLPEDESKSNLKNLGEAAQEDMKEIFEMQSAKDFIAIKKDLESAENIELLQDYWIKWKKEINSFQKRDKKRYTLLLECKDSMKEELEPDLEDNDLTL